MSLAPGTRLNNYEVGTQLGVGGMGEVYRARDTRLHREVAIKILPPLFAADPERLARFEREAQLLAALNHHNIAQIYGVEEGANVSAIVMELVDGPTVADLIAKPGGVASDDALDVGRQISEALEAAHDHGIIHRDLKPANIKVRRDGVVKVLDFGLAKVMAEDTAASVGTDLVSDSPTFTSPVVTRVGVILGTAAYMAPEQARGKISDRRVDIWAFGCVLYEMLSGKRPFQGETVTDVLSAIVSREPDWNALPAHVPRAISRLLRRCLEKDPRKRLRDIGEARLVLESPQSPSADPSPFRADASVRSRSWITPVLIATVVILALLAGYLAFGRPRPQVAAATITRFDVYPPDPAAALMLVFRPVLDLSANGATVAFVATSSGVERIYVRTRSDPATRVIPGSERGSAPALSPDGKWVVFFAEGAIKKAAIDGEATTIGTGRDVRGISWADDGTLVLTADAASPLVTMPATGGAARQVTTLASGERSHRWSQVLPGGRAVLFTVGMLASPDSYDAGNIDAVNLVTGERRVVIQGAAMARYCGDGRLLYSKGAGLFAVAFDPDRLTVSSDPIEVIPAVARDASTGAAHFSCANDGTLAFVPGTSLSELRTLIWVDPSGKTEAVKLPGGAYQDLRLSPDGTRATLLLAGSSGSGDVWVYEFARSTFNRLTFTGTNAAPAWSTNGQFVYYTSFDASGIATTLLKMPADGSRQAVAIAKVPGRAYVAWINPSETEAILDAVNPSANQGDIVRVKFGTSPEPLIASPGNEFGAAVSVSGNWLAYQSDDSGRQEVYVRDLGASGARWQATFGGGEEPHWSSDGRQLFYRSANRLMMLPLETGSIFRPGQPRGLFEGVYATGIQSGRSYDVSPTTGRFLIVRPADESDSRRLVRIVLNWAFSAPKQ